MVSNTDNSQLGCCTAVARFPRDQAPHYYRFMLGNAPATIVSDGILPIGRPVTLFPNVSYEKIVREIEENFLSFDDILAEQNALVVVVGGKTVLFDTGMGSLKRHGDIEFGDACGMLVTNLVAAGINPESIDAVVMTHGHIDHAGGLVSEDGVINFPNAEYYISKKEFEFWTDIEQPNHLQRNHARKNLLPIEHRLHLIEDGEEFLPGVTAISTPGHAPGHMMFMIEIDGQKLAFLGDLIHHHVLQAESGREIAFDGEPRQAAETRTNTLKMLADNRIWCSVFHFPWPGLGHFVHEPNNRFRFIPTPMKLLDRVDRSDPKLVWP